MTDPNVIHENIKDTMIDIMAVLYEQGIRQVHMGAMMRLLGVDDAKASEFDGEYIQLDESFIDTLTESNKITVPIDIPPGTIFH